MDILRNLLAYAPEKRRWMISSLILSGLATIMLFIPYYYFWLILSEMLGQSRPELIQLYAVSVLGWTVVYSLTYFFSLICSHVFAFRIETNMKKRGVQALLNASFSFFDKESSGRVRKIIDDNTQNTHMIIAHILPDSVNALLFPLILLVMAFSLRISLGFFLLGAIVFAILCFVGMFGRSSEQMMKDYLGALEQINSETVEYVRGIQVIKIFNTAVNSFERLHKAILHYSSVVNQQCQQCRLPYTLMQSGLMSLGMLFVPLSLYWIHRGDSINSVVVSTAFMLSFSVLLLMAFMQIMMFKQNFLLAKDAVDKLEDIFGQMEENKLPSGKLKELSNADIVLKNVSFAYDKENKIIENLSLTLPAGKVYALVGSSGGGKSTLAKIISGFYPPTEGQICLGDTPLNDYSQQARSQGIAFVFQHAKLFHSSIYENVLIGRPQASREEVMQALHDAMCDDILDKFEEREHTVIGSEGVYLSGGEVQRISVARALLKDAPIVVLDEAAAASDPENEYEMQRAFKSLMRNKTVIMIAHRLSSIRGAHEILLIEEGKVSERGTHDELMQQQGRYAHLTRLYEEAQQWRLS